MHLHCFITSLHNDQQLLVQTKNSFNTQIESYNSKKDKFYLDNKSD